MLIVQQRILQQIARTGEGPARSNQLRTADRDKVVIQQAVSLQFRPAADTMTHGKIDPFTQQIYSPVGGADLDLNLWITSFKISQPRQQPLNGEAAGTAERHLFWPRGHLQALGGGGYLEKGGLNGPQVDLPHLR